MASSFNNQARNPDGRYAPTSTGTTRSDVLDGAGTTDRNVHIATGSIASPKLADAAFRARGRFVIGHLNDGESPEDIQAEWDAEMDRAVATGNVSDEGAEQLRFGNVNLAQIITAWEARSDRHVDAAAAYIDEPEHAIFAFKSRDQFMAARNPATATDLNHTMGVMDARALWDDQVDATYEAGNVSSDGAQKLRFNKHQQTTEGLAEAQRQNLTDRINAAPSFRDKEIEEAIFTYGVGHPVVQGEGSRERYLEARAQNGRTPAQAIEDWDGEVNYAIALE